MLTMRCLSGAAVAALFALSTSAASAAAITVTLEQPGVYTPHFITDASGQGICEKNINAQAACAYGVESFGSFTRAQATNGFTSTFTTGPNSFVPGEVIDGAYSGQIGYNTTNQYGGVDPNGGYPVASGTTTYHLSFATQNLPGVNYLGIWITAMDASNLLRVHMNDGTEFDLNTSVLKSFISKTANPSAYYGNPIPGANYQKDMNEPYAYVNFYNSSGFFTSVDFTNTSSSGFESSNHAAGYFDPLYIAGAVVSVTEPVSMSLLGTALAGMAAVRSRRRR